MPAMHPAHLTKFCISIWTSLLVMMMPGIASAQAGEGAEMLLHQPTKSLTPLSTNIFGDRMDMSSGSASFYTVDVSIPGNSDLPFQVGRRFERGMEANAKWTIDAPRLDNVSYCDQIRPSVSGPPGFDENSVPAAWAAKGGLKLSVPNHSTKQVLRVNSNYFGAGAVGGTKDFWYTSCLSHPTYLDTLVQAPNGDKYYFDVASGNTDAEFYGDPAWQEFGLMQLYASKIEDVNGNSVEYEYYKNADNFVTGVKRIYSDDGREINITYHSNGNIKSVETNGRTWNYNSTATTVTLPDGNFWQYTNMSSFGKEAPNFNDQSDVGVVLPLVTVKHPYGATMSYKVQGIRNGIYRSTCISFPQTPYPYSHLSYAVVEKKLSHNSQTHIWDFYYEQDQGSCTGSVSKTKYRTATAPDGSKTKQYFNRETSNMRQNRIEKEEAFNSSNQLLQTTITEYLTGPELGSSGTGSISNSDVYITKRQIMRDGDTYTSELDYDLDINSSNFSYGFPTVNRSYSNISTTPRETITTYEHNTTKWVLGLPKTVTTNGRNMASYDYDSLGRKEEQYRYGHSETTFGYNSDGTLDWIEDAINRRTELQNWNRGTPQVIVRAVGTVDEITVQQNVDNNGWLTSTVDAKLNTTSYQYDSMGRLKLIDPPESWTNTSISYNFSGGGVVQTITKGNGKEEITYDSLFRPTLVKTWATDNGSTGPSYVKTSYNGMGQTTFTSFPSTSSNPTNGTDFTYDGLGRIYSEKETVFPYAEIKHRYYSYHRHRIHDPSGAWTDYYSYGYDGPGNTDYRAIYQYKDGTYLRRTYLYKNVWGQMTQLRQWGDEGGVSVDERRYYYYDARQRLCRYREDEGNSTVYDYNDAGEMTDYEKGRANASGCATPAGTAKVSMTYDNLGRTKLIDFADANTPDISTVYDDNSNVESVSRGSGSTAITRTNTYDALNNLTAESITVDGIIGQLGYNYNADGNLTSRTLPSGRLVEYAPDGLGRMTKVQDGSTLLGNTIKYHPNGAVKELTYGNGQFFQRTLNSRLLPEQVTSSFDEQHHALNLTYSYDERRKVTSIINAAIPNDDRTFSYDALGQLKSSTGPWNVGSYTYDSLGNLRSRIELSRIVTNTIDSKNRVSASHDTSTGVTRAVNYDHRGNVIQLGDLSFVYDYSDQPTSISGLANGTYIYDGNKKRVKSEITKDGVTKTIYNMYDASGSLVFVYKLTDLKQYEYIHGPDGTLARIEVGGETTYLHNDHLGSGQTGTDGVTGAIKWREQYTPFGETMNALSVNDDLDGFTGHIKDSATGLTYMQARYYDPLIGRFLSIDPVGFEETGDPAMFNRYAYCYNDPINCTDPDGEFGHIFGGAAIGALIGGVVAGATEYLSQEPGKRDLRAIAGHAFSGAVGGAMTGATFAATAGTSGLVSTGIVGAHYGAAHAMGTIAVDGAVGKPGATDGALLKIATGTVLGGTNVNPAGLLKLTGNVSAKSIKEAGESLGNRVFNNVLDAATPTLVDTARPLPGAALDTMLQGQGVQTVEASKDYCREDDKC